MNRRTMLSKTAKAAAALAIPTKWADSQNRVSGPIFEPRRYGAKGDGITKDTDALQAAVDACTQAGGGTVLLSRGTYVSGTLVLKSNVTLELQAGATILGSPDFSDYFMPPEGVIASKGQKWPRFLFALNAQNVTLLGPGTIDGNAKVFYKQVDHPFVKPGDEYRDIAALSTQRIHLISPMVVMANIHNLRIENITLQNAAGWALHPVGVMGGVIRNVKVRNGIDHTNADGIDPTSCQDLLVDNCDVVAGDDAIVITSYNMYNGNQISRNITVQNCRVTTCCNALRVGMNDPNPIDHVTFRNCEIYSVPGPYNVRPISGISVVSNTQSTMSDITFDGITMVNARAPIQLRLQTKGTLENIVIKNVRATGASLTSTITGLPANRISNVLLSNVSISTEEPGKLEFTQNVIQEKEGAYPNSFMFGRLPSYGFYVRHTDGLTLQNVTVTSQVGDPRPMLSCDDLQQLTVNGVTGTPSDPSQPFLDLKNVRGAQIQGNQAPPGTGVFAKVSGANTHNVQIQGNDLRQSKSPVLRSLEVPADGVGPVN